MSIIRIKRYFIILIVYTTYLKYLSLYLIKSIFRVKFKLKVKLSIYLYIYII